MLGFRQRPLTWLFWIATLCAGAVGVSTDPDSAWLTSLIFGALLVICSWAAVGETHRLGRAAVAVVAPLVLGLIAYMTQRAPNEGSVVLAFSLLLGCLTMLLTGILSLFVRSLPGQPRLPDRRWQISIAELLGWTIVTAIASWALTLADLPPLEHVHGIWTTLATPVPVAVIVASFLAPLRRHDRISLVVSVAVYAGFLLAGGALDNQSPEDLQLFSGIFAYVALWVLVVRLDETSQHGVDSTIAEGDEPAEPQIRLARESTRDDDRAVTFDEL